ncbi:GNAT family N-acetyltransferase [Actinocorallia sp. API 0066]|uniref:GNAT family N-acetyltransferase n=1 Tax=Actinocorallia sp. API 0066 TaxID=2896846 RepID=UPI001E30AC98|nr:GNAT family protein [Actinocorallia sp. API 0066]MCD0452586.1 GNAT family N-acetyltransferase [Actinocorallia sp. API 0066]
MYRVVLRRLRSADAAEVARLARLSITLHGSWVYMPRTAPAYLDYLARLDEEGTIGLAVRHAEEDTIVGLVTISGITRGGYERAILGYAGFAPTTGHGYLTEGLCLALHYGFTRLGLHRLEADIQPENTRSLRLAARVGLRREGFSPAFIMIDGVWRDHERWAITAEEARGLAPCAPWQLPDT